MQIDESGIDYREVDIEILVMNRPHSIGCDHVALEALRLLELDINLANNDLPVPRLLWQLVL